jgi:hypothetical protein
MIMQQKVHRTNMLELATINGLPMGFFRPKQFSNPIHGQEAPQPVPLIIVANKQSDIAVTAFVARATKYDFSERKSDSETECGEIDGVLGLIGRLSAVVGAEFRGEWHVE